MRRHREAMREKEGVCVESVWKERKRVVRVFRDQGICSSESLKDCLRARAEARVERLLKRHLPIGARQSMDSVGSFLELTRVGISRFRKPIFHGLGILVLPRKI